MKELTAAEIVNAIDCPILDHFPNNVPIGFVIRRRDFRGHPDENMYRLNRDGSTWARITWPVKPVSYYDSLN